MARRFIFVVSTIAAFLAGPAHAASKSNWPSGPDWLHKPTGQDVANYYPEKGQRDAVSAAGSSIAT